MRHVKVEHGMLVAWLAGGGPTESPAVSDINGRRLGPNGGRAQPDGVG